MKPTGKLTLSSTFHQLQSFYVDVWQARGHEDLDKQLQKPFRLLNGT